jgi:prophage antirepressor-like protein
MTRITRYLFGEDSAETITTRTYGGQHYYMAEDICRLLGIKNHVQAVHRKRTRDHLTLNETEWRKETEYIGGHGKKQILLVNDNGMFKLIFQGTSDVAREVQKRARCTSRDLIPAAWQEEVLEISYSCKSSM